MKCQDCGVRVEAGIRTCANCVRAKYLPLLMSVAPEIRKHEAETLSKEDAKFEMRWRIEKLRKAKMTLREIAQAVGRSRSFVHNYIKTMGLA